MKRPGWDVGECRPHGAAGWSAKEVFARASAAWLPELPKRWGGKHPMPLIAVGCDPIRFAEEPARPHSQGMTSDVDELRSELKRLKARVEALEARSAKASERAERAAELRAALRERISGTSRPRAELTDDFVRVVLERDDGDE